MSRQDKIVATFLLIVLGALLIDFNLEKSSVEKKLDECSTYTLANVERVYKIRGMAHVVYTYHINSISLTHDKSVNIFDTGESWVVDLDKLKSRRMLVQAYCQDPKIHRILWNTVVPEKVYEVPFKGWEKPPFPVLED
jgi:hypothetical protein